MARRKRKNRNYAIEEKLENESPPTSSDPLSQTNSSTSSPRRKGKTYYYAAQTFHHEDDIQHQKELFYADRAADSFIYVDVRQARAVSRKEYNKLKTEKLQPGDTLVIESLYRIGKWNSAIVKELEYFRQHNIRLRVLDIPALAKRSYTPSEPSPKQLMDCIISTLESLSRNKEREDEEGENAAKERERKDEIGDSVSAGRPIAKTPKHWDEVIGKYLAKEISSKEAIELTGLTRTIFFRFVKEEKEKRREGREVKEVVDEEDEEKYK